MPHAKFSGEVVDFAVPETWCGAGTNGTDFAAAALQQPSATVSEVSHYYLNLQLYPGVKAVVLIFNEGDERLELEVSSDTLSFMSCKAWVKQLTACKSMQVVKMVAKGGEIARPRKVRQGKHDFRASIFKAAQVLRPGKCSKPRRC